jgi:hypothetical protein
MTETPENAHADAKHDAEHKAAALHNVGWFSGSGPTIWARAIRDELERHEAARCNWRGDIAAWERLHSTAFILLVAADQILAYARRVRKLTGDGDLNNAMIKFETRVADAESLRDLVTHLDEYAVGLGERQTGKREPPITEKYLRPLVYWTEASGTYFVLDREQVELRELATAALDLADATENVRIKHIPLVEDKAREAGRLLYAYDIVDGKIVTPDVEVDADDAEPASAG